MIRGATVATLVGRSREVETLSAAVAAAAAGRGQVVLLEGEPGIGKTRLVEVVRDRALTAGFTVCLGACEDLVAPRPFAGLLHALSVESNSTDADRAAIAAMLDVPTAEGAGATIGPVNPGLQYRVTEALGALVEGLAARGPLLLAVDDVQWADSSALAALRSICRRVATLPVVVLVAFRFGHENQELHRVTDDLLRAGATHMTVGPLDDEAVASLVADVLERQPSAELLLRTRGASGNPLFVIEYVRSTATPAADDDVSTTPEFRLTVLRRLAALPETTNRVLQLASVLGATFSPSELGIVAGMSAVDLAAALQPCIAAALVEDRGSRLAFRHALIRDAIYEHIPSAMRRELHREVGRALAAANADARSVARHLSLAAEGEDLEAVDWIRRAAREAASRAPGVAVELLERALQLTGPTAPQRNHVRADLAMALAWSGRLGDAEALCTEILADKPDASVAGPLRCNLAYALTWQGKAAAALAHVTLQPDEQLSPHDAIRLRAEAAVASMWTFDMKSVAAAAPAVAADAERAGLELPQAQALTAQALAANFAGQPLLAVDLAQQAVAIAERSATGEAHLAHPRWFTGIPLLSLDRIDEGEQLLRTGLRVAESLGLAWSFPLYHTILGAKGFIIGDWDGAIAELDAALSIADDVGLHVGIIAAASGWLAMIQVHRDDLEAAEQTVETALSRLVPGPQLGIGPFNCARALVLEARNRPEEAVTFLQAAWDVFAAGSPVRDASSGAPISTDPWMPMTILRLLVERGDIARAESLLPSIDFQREYTGTPFMQGQAMRARALVEQDADAMVRAVPLYRQSPRLCEIASACEDAARLLALAGRVEEGEPFWDESIELYERLGAVRDTARVRAALRQYGVRRGTRRSRVRATTGWESLTDTEHKVIALVAQGLSNPDVAERLFVSRYTVESHLKSIYRKLGLTSRLQLASIAHRQSVP